MYFHSRLSSIISHYDAFIVDLWGVIHDGQTLYPHAIETLEMLKAAEKKILFLSNAPRRASAVISALEHMGVARHLYMDAVSSGELCYRAFSHPQEGSFIADLSNKYLYIGPARDMGLLDGLPLSETTVATEASFVLAVGFDEDSSVLAEKMPVLQAAKAASLPMICVNPDRIVVRQTGERSLCAGILGEAYEELGGIVYYFGKPYRSVYETCFEMLQGIDKSRIAAIGDSLETDIRGAMQIGIDSILVTGGILAEELGIRPRETADRVKLEQLCAAHDVLPTYVISSFF